MLNKYQGIFVTPKYRKGLSMKFFSWLLGCFSFSCWLENQPFTEDFREYIQSNPDQSNPPSESLEGKLARYALVTGKSPFVGDCDAKKINGLLQRSGPM